MARHPLKATWYGIRSRCYNNFNPQYWNYGGRGIKVCDRWLYGEDGLAGFECFVADMGPKPSNKHSVDREKVNGNYEPQNCVWATKSQQVRNRRPEGGIAVAGTPEAAIAMARRERYYQAVNVDALQRQGLYREGMTPQEMDRALASMMWGNL